MRKNKRLNENYTIEIKKTLTYNALKKAIEEMMGGYDVEYNQDINDKHLYIFDGLYKDVTIEVWDEKYEDLELSEVVKYNGSEECYKKIYNIYKRAIALMKGNKKRITESEVNNFTKFLGRFSDVYIELYPFTPEDEEDEFELMDGDMCVENFDSKYKYALLLCDYYKQPVTTFKSYDDKDIIMIYCHNDKNWNLPEVVLTTNIDDLVDVIVDINRDKEYVKAVGKLSGEDVISTTTIKKRTRYFLHN